MPPWPKESRLLQQRQICKIVVLIFITTIFAKPVICAEKPDDDLLIKEALTSLDLKNASCVVFIGKNNAEINELKKFLRHDDTLTVDKIKNSNKFKLNANEEKTFVPRLSFDLETRSRLFTFADTESDLPTQFFNLRVFETGGGMKLAIVVNLSDLLGDYYFETLTQAVKNVVGILGNQLRWYGNSFCLIATKVDKPNHNDSVLLNELEYKVGEYVKFSKKKMEEALLNNALDQVAEFEGYMAVGNAILRKKGFGILRTPTAKKNPWSLAPLQRNYNQLRRLVFQTLEFSERIGSVADIGVTAAARKEIQNKFIPRSEIKMRDILRNLTTSLEEALSGKLFNQFETFSVKFFPAAFDKLATFEQLEPLVKLLDFQSRRGEDVASVTYLIKFYYNIVGKSFEQYQELHVAECKVEFQRIFSEALHNYAFLMSLRRDFGSLQVQKKFVENKSAWTTDLSIEKFLDWQKSLAIWGFAESTIQLPTKPNIAMVQTIKSLAWSVPANEITYNSDTGFLLYSGHFVFLSQVKNLILNNNPHEIEIVALRKVFIDCDLELKDTHLTIWASVMQVVSKTTILLTGSNAQPADKNTPGAGGKTGFSSGQLHLMAQQIEHPELLVIESSGGNGSDGVEGKPGADNIDASFDGFADFTGFDGQVQWRSDEINYKWKDDRLYVSHCDMYDCWDVVFGTRCAYRVDVKKNYYNYPNQGEQGGSAGAGGLPGEIRVRGMIQQKQTSGLSGQPGKGGPGGILLWMTRQFYCESNKYGKDQSCWRGDRTYYFSSGLQGYTGQNKPPAINYKNSKKRALFDSFLRLNLLAIFSPALISPEDSFLQFASMEDVVKEFTTKNFFKFLGEVQDAFVNTTHTANLKIVVSSMQESFSIFKELRKETNSTYLNLIELMFVDTLSKCDSLSTGRQVVKLGDKITNEIHRLSELKDIKRDLFVYETVKKEGEKAAKEIAASELELQKFYNEEMKKAENEINSKLEELVSNVHEEQEEYENNIAQLEHNKEEYKVAMRRKTISKIFGWGISIVGSMYPVVGIAGKAMLSLADSGGTPTPGNIEGLLPDITHASQNAASVIADYWREKESEARSKREAQLEAMKLFMNDTETAKQIMSEQQYKDTIKIVDAVSQSEDDDEESWGVFSTTFDAVEEILDGADEGPEIKTLKSVFKSTKSGFLAAKEVFNFARDLISMKSNLAQFDAAIDANRVAIAELDAYGQMIDDQFIPMLEDMRDRLDTMQTGLKDANSVLKGIRAFEMKNKIRDFTGFITRFTHGFLEEDDFAGLSAHLQDMVSVLADGYEKIEQMGYRLEMKQFIGTISGGECNQAADIETCNAYQAAQAEVEKSHLLVAFIEIFAAYRQVIFPFGADKVKILARLVDKLRNQSLNSEEAKREVQASLGVLKRELDDMSTSITHQDKDIIYALFNPKFRTGRAFYSWPAGREHLDQVVGLLSGTEVSLVASENAKDSRNAVKFKDVRLHFNSTDPKIDARVQNLLLSFRLEATHVGPSRYRCGATTYVVGGEPLHFSVTYERDASGQSVEINEALSKLKNGDVPLSPYSVWRFKLKHIAFDDEHAIREELITMAEHLNLQLIGEGYYIKEDAQICSTLNNAYSEVQHMF